MNSTLHLDCYDLFFLQHLLKSLLLLASHVSEPGANQVE